MADGGKEQGAATPADGVAPPPLLAERYRLLELALVDAATAALTGVALPEGAPLVSAETAVKLLTLRGSAIGKRAGEAPMAPDALTLRLTLAARIAAVRSVAARPASGAPVDPSA